MSAHCVCKVGVGVWGAVCDVCVPSSVCDVCVHVCVVCGDCVVGRISVECVCVHGVCGMGVLLDPSGAVGSLPADSQDATDGEASAPPAPLGDFKEATLRGDMMGHIGTDALWAW